jgi:YD repeat-containing protein
METSRNRTAQSSQSGACPTLPSLPTATATYNANNQVTWTSVHGAALGLGYDAAGNVINDNLNSYLYDSDGRLCAVMSTPVTGFSTLTGYLYSS